MVFGPFSKLLPFKPSQFASSKRRRKYNNVFEMMTDRNFNPKKTHIGGDLIQRDYGNQLYGKRRREFYCQNGKTLVNARSFEEAKTKINSCGSGSWQKDIIRLYNAGALTKKDRNCCDQHDACYQGYHLGTGKSRIRNGHAGNEECEDEFASCMAKNGSSQGKKFPTATQMVSPNYYMSKRFKCV